MESSPIIEMATSAKKPKPANKQEGSNTSTDVNKNIKSQEQLREALQNRLTSISTQTQQDLDRYKQMLIDGSFDDKDGEEPGSGEKRKEIMQSQITSSTERAEKIKKTLDSRDELPQSLPQIEVTYTHTNTTTNKPETQEITLDIEKKLQEFISFYQKTNIDLPPTFEADISDIWERNQDEIQKAIEENGFDDILLMPPNIPLPDLAEKMKMGKGYYQSSNFTDGGSFAGAVSQNIDKPRIILYHHTETLPEITQKTGLDVHLNITGADIENLFNANPNHYLSTLEDFLVLERKFFEETGKHLSDWNTKSAHWLPGTKSGARLVDAGWDPDRDRLYVNAFGPDDHNENLGARPSRSFY